MKGIDAGAIRPAHGCSVVAWAGAAAHVNRSSAQPGHLSARDRPNLVAPRRCSISATASSGGAIPPHRVPPSHARSAVGKNLDLCPRLCKSEQSKNVSTFLLNDRLDPEKS